MRNLTDLKLLDEVLLDYMRELGLQPHHMPYYSSTTRDAIARLREAWERGEMSQGITMTWAEYFAHPEHPWVFKPGCSCFQCTACAEGRP